MKKALGALMGLAAVGTVAMTDRAEAQAYNWSGIYFGGHLGYMWSEVSASFVEEPTVPFPTVSQGTGVAGLQIGVQQQWGSFILGLEAGVTFPFDDEGTARFAPPIGPNAIAVAGIDTIFTIGPRLGWSLGAWMPYVTGGYASAEVSVRLSDTIGGETIQSSKQHGGWYFGGGIDWALTPSVILGLEYRHYDFDSKLHVPSVPGGPAVFDARYKVDPEADMVTARLSFLIGRQPEPAPRPLK